MMKELFNLGRFEFYYKVASLEAKKQCPKAEHRRTVAAARAGRPGTVERVYGSIETDGG
jgi:hypothetical protein